MKNLIITCCDYGYSDVLSLCIENMQRYASRIGADLLVHNSGYPYVDRYHAILEASCCANISYLDCDLYIRPDAPSIFDVGYKTVAYVKCEKTEYRDSITEAVGEAFPDFNENSYAFAGVTVGRSRYMKDIAQKVIDLWYEAPKANHYFMNDEAYLCQVLNKYYGDFFRLPEQWVKTTEKTLDGDDDFFFSHPFCRKDEKISQLRKLKEIYG